MLARLAVLLVGLLLAFAAPEFAAAQKDKPKADGSFVHLGELTATVTLVEASERHLTVQYTPPGQEASVNLDLKAADDLKVRLLKPPPVFDNRGKPRAYTTKELKELRGPDPKQPGYTGEFANLKSGQTVLVTLAQRKEVVKKPAPKGKAAVPAPKKDDPTVPKERLIVTRVVVVKEAPPQP